MPDTEQKILEAALKVFSEKGYKGATTKIIAEESGFSEFTLFRKFKSKENLLELVLAQGAKNLKKEFMEIFIEKDFTDQRSLVEYLVKSLDQVVGHNFQFLNISMNLDGGIKGQAMGEFIDSFTQYVEKKLPGQEIDYGSFTLSIFAFTYMINLEIYRSSSINSHATEGFIDNLTLSLR
jgi:AcrR family transcriptional regulator